MFLFTSCIEIKRKILISRLYYFTYSLDIVVFRVLKLLSDIYTLNFGGIEILIDSK